MATAGMGEGWRCLSCDHDPMKARAYRENWEGHPVVVQDVRGLTAGQVGEHADLLWASPPCQDVSIAGLRGGLDGGRGGSLWPALDFLRQLATAGKAPRLVAIENVPGLATGRQGKDLAAICGVLADLGYRMGAMLIDAKLLVPQSRLRLFIVAVARDIQVPAALVAARPVEPWHPAPLVRAADGLPAALKQAWLWWQPPVPDARRTVLADVLIADAEATWRSVEATEAVLVLMSDRSRAEPGCRASPRQGRRDGLAANASRRLQDGAHAAGGLPDGRRRQLRSDRLGRVDAADAGRGQSRRHPDPGTNRPRDRQAHGPARHLRPTT